jgi:hypothetical protein
MGEIMRIPEEFNSNDLLFVGKNPGHSVNYYVYTDKRKGYFIPTAEMLKDALKIKHVCFAGLTSYLKRGVNRIAYEIRQRSIGIELSDDDMHRFLTISKRNNAIPKYVDVGKVVNSKMYVLKVDDNLPNDLLYVYLTVARSLEEEAYFVKNMLVLCEKYKMPYALAWTVGSRLSVCNNNHNFIRACRNYGDQSSLLIDINLREASALSIYLRNRIKLQGPFMRNTGFGAAIAIESSLPSKVPTMKVRIQDLLKKDVYESCKTDSIDEVLLRFKSIGAK